MQSTVDPFAPLGVLFPGDRGVPRGLIPARKAHFSPRLGFAWDVTGDGKTAIRGGAGLFYGTMSANIWNQPADHQPFGARLTLTAGGCVRPRESRGGGRRCRA